MQSRAPSLALAACLTALPALAQGGVTTTTVSIGGNFAIGCTDPTQNPPLLSNGTPASASLDLTYDAQTCVLSLDITNTSAVTTGVPNPFITAIALNLPLRTVTLAEIGAQSSAAGTPPAFGLQFDPGISPQLGFGCFGNFNLLLTTQGSAGSIGNAAASTFGAPAGTFALGPARIDIKLIGPGVSLLTAKIIAAGLSQAAAVQQVTSAMDFSRGGPNAAGDGILSSTAIPGNNPNFYSPRRHASPRRLSSASAARPARSARCWGRPIPTR